MTPELFITESNRIEGIHRPASKAEVEEYIRFMALAVVTVEELEHFVSVYQPGARLRDQEGLDVRVGKHTPPRGGPGVRKWLVTVLKEATVIGPYQTHVLYEQIHPFTDGNGRSGRMLWAWQMRDFPLGFLHHFYYQSLSGR